MRKLHPPFTKCLLKHNTVNQSFVMSQRVLIFPRKQATNSTRCVSSSSSAVLRWMHRRHQVRTSWWQTENSKKKTHKKTVAPESLNSTGSVSEVGTYGIKQDPVLLVFFGVQHVVTVTVAETDIDNSLASAAAQNFHWRPFSLMKGAFDVRAPHCHR